MTRHCPTPDRLLLCAQTLLCGCALLLAPVSGLSADDATPTPATPSDQAPAPAPAPTPDKPSDQASAPAPASTPDKPPEATPDKPPEATADKPPAPPAPEIAALQQALGGDDSDAKREALRALADKSIGDDNLVLPLLVQAVGDRQASDTAIQVLRARTGLQPAAYVGQSHYPSYPSDDTPGAWAQWLGERAKDVEEKAKLKEALKIARSAEDTAKKAESDATSGDKAPDAKTAAGGSASAAAIAPKTKPKYAPEDLGKLTRVVFKNGDNLICYILTRRTDVDGNLVSLRIVHPDGSGEETLDAALIARVEEDVR
jgi:hypothetical protein